MKKNNLLILVAIVLIIIIGFIAFNYFNDSVETFDVGESTFIMPDGYKIGSPNNFGATNITNGNNTIFVYEYDGEVDECIKDYEHFLEEKNESIDKSIFTFDDKVVHKANNNVNKATIHYYFVKDNKTYDIYKWDKNDNMESIVIDLINSIH